VTTVQRLVHQKVAVLYCELYMPIIVCFLSVQRPALIHSKIIQFSRRIGGAGVVRNNYFASDYIETKNYLLFAIGTQPKTKL
jgi:hypothetical protein